MDKTTLKLINDCNFKNKKFISSGSQGKVYEVKVNKKSFVIKYYNQLHDYKLHNDELIMFQDYLYSSSREIMVRKIIEHLHLKNRIPLSFVLEYNDWKKSDYTSDEDLNTFKIPSSKILCKVIEPYSYYNSNFKIKTYVRPNDYVCFSNIYTESMISIFITNEIINTNICLHFVKSYSLLECDNDSKVLVMEKVERSLMDYLEENIIFTADHLFVVILTIFVLSEYYIEHGDLTFRNILMDKSSNVILEDLTKVSDYDYMRYDIKGRLFYIEVREYFLKIADFGFSQKFKSPKILQHQLMVNGGFDTGGIQDLLCFIVDYSRIVDQVSNIKMIMRYIFGDMNFGMERLEQYKKNEQLGIMETFFEGYDANDIPILDYNIFDKFFSSWKKAPPKDSRICVVTRI